MLLAHYKPSASRASSAAVTSASHNSRASDVPCTAVAGSGSGVDVAVDVCAFVSAVAAATSAVAAAVKL
jgi:K+-transporting ATPase c subunit